MIHELKVQPPYFEALRDGTKTFEVRRNDRAFQRGDRLKLTEMRENGWTVNSESTPLHFEVTYVYAGDPRFGGVEPGHVVLGLRPLVPSASLEATE